MCALALRGSDFRCEARLARVGEFSNDLDAILLGPLADLILLDRNRIFLSVLGRVPLVGHSPEFGYGSQQLGRIDFPPLRHRSSP